MSKEPVTIAAQCLVEAQRCCEACDLTEESLLNDNFAGEDLLRLTARLAALAAEAEAVYAAAEKAALAEAKRNPKGLGMSAKWETRGRRQLYGVGPEGDD
jgi:hypothetical protein